MAEARIFGFEWFTPMAAARLVRFAGVSAGQAVLDVGCGTGIVAVTAARRGARAVGVDVDPVLLGRAKEHAATAGVDVEWLAQDAHTLPYATDSFDVVLSQLGHIFMKDPMRGLAEMLRVLKPGGMLGLTTYPPESLSGKIFRADEHYRGIAEDAGPSAWGRSSLVRERLGDRVEDVLFDLGTMRVPYLSPEHFLLQRSNPPSGSATNDQNIERIRAWEDAAHAYFDEDENVLRMGYLLTRARKTRPPPG